MQRNCLFLLMFLTDLHNSIPATFWLLQRCSRQLRHWPIGETTEAPKPFSQYFIVCKPRRWSWRAVPGNRLAKFSLQRLVATSVITSKILYGSTPQYFQSRNDITSYQLRNSENKLALLLFSGTAANSDHQLCKTNLKMNYVIIAFELDTAS